MKLLLSVLLLLFPATLTMPLATDRQQEQHCLGNIIYHEARGESLRGQRAVANVVLNRAKHKLTTVCNVMAQPKQFSWYAKQPVLLPKEVLSKQLVVAAQMYIAHARNERVVDDYGSTHFAHKRIKNNWTTQLKRTHVINNHVFYREKR